MVAPADASAIWAVTRCPACQEYRASLQATRDVRGDEELTVAGDRLILGAEEQWPFEVTFDGGAREINGQSAAGAGAILWGPPQPNWSWPALARAWAALPSEPNAQVAEA